MKKNKFSKQILITLTIAILSFTSCKKDDDIQRSGRFYGEEIEIGDGKAKAWVDLDNEGNPSAVGVSLTEKALDNLPHEHGENVPPPSFELSLPQEKLKTPFDHITLDWNAHGHEPTEIYGKPHFDFHFYMMSKEERSTISLNDPKSEELPDGKYLPATYVPIPGGVPMMGKHWVNPYSEEFGEGTTFTKTFIYGSHNKKVTFYEPMITLDYLLTKPNVTENIPQPEAFQTSGYYPQKYSVKYDPAKKEYIISLDNLIKK